MIARNMVIKWGLSDKLGPQAFHEDEGEVFLGRAVTQHKNMSDDTAKLIDEEIGAIIERNYDRARQILVDKMDTLHAMADALMQYETLTSDQIDDVMAGRPVRPSCTDQGTPPAPNHGSTKPNGGRSKGGIVGHPVGQN